MYRAGFVSLQDVPRTTDHAPSRTLYTWRVEIDAAADKLASELYKAALNVCLRLDFEYQRQKDVSLLCPSSLSCHITASAAVFPCDMYTEVHCCLRDQRTVLVSSLFNVARGHNSKRIYIHWYESQSWTSKRSELVTSIVVFSVDFCCMQILELVNKGMAQAVQRTHGAQLQKFQQTLIHLDSALLRLDSQIAVFNDF